MAEPGNPEQPLKRNPHGNEPTIRRLMNKGSSEEEARHEVIKSLMHPVAGQIIREERKKTKEAQELSLIDPLTGLPNKRWLLGDVSGELPRLFALAHRHNHPFHVMMLDIDNFKEYNDTYGHPEGDNALKTVADRIRDNIRESDFAARFGGEEFTILVPETGLKGARLLADKIRMSIAASKDFKSQMTVSIGLASYPWHDQKDTAGTMLKRADDALYQAKNGGKNQVALWHDEQKDQVVDIRDK